MSINKVILVGNVGKDPEVRYVETNVCVANFPLATSERGYTSRSGAQIPERTEWHNIVLWRGLAEVAEKYVKKGTQLYIEGKLRTRSWTDSNNVVRYTTEIYADNMEILSRRDTNNSQPAQTQPAVETPIVDESNDLPF
ncbi:MAG: single-stranded DNA-binding protein [Bacteroidales bacterium]|nr:single-stranded DNA-binding protein [Bacteroidales bacterium]